jgi:SAM-dependent methyltransferase
MGVKEFLELFIHELEINTNLRGYYRLLDNGNRFWWRKAYLEQRLAYVHAMLGDKPCRIWDAGCGFGTTAIFACLNGHQVHGSTLEFYYDQLPQRFAYWNQFGSLAALQIAYENIFDRPVVSDSYDVVLAQDTLHHLEPIGDAVGLFNRVLVEGGRLVVSEENGNNPFICGKNIATRGFRRVGEYYDERLKKSILFGNENARSLAQWRKILEKERFVMQEKNVAYIRMLPPQLFKSTNYDQLVTREQQLGKKHTLLREMLFFGINFTATKHTNKLSSS